MIKIAFSWDDGAIEDMKLMDLSLKCEIPGIFFIPATNSERSVLPANNIRTLFSNNFEIGAHTYSHVYLTNIDLKEAGEELLTGKDFLEQLIGKEVPHFCFPGGKSNNDLIEESKKYFRSARTADTGAVVSHDSFVVKPAFHFYNRGRYSLIYNSLRNKSPILRVILKNILISDYFDLIRIVIEELAESPDIYKIIIWGHSWELEEFNLWKHLEYLFTDIKKCYPACIQSYSDLILSE